MNREIKFRAWNGTKMVHLNLFQSKHHEDDFYLIDQDVAGGYIDDKPAQVSWPIMQYTGLKDNNGVEIYEGDIVQCYRSGTSKAYKSDRFVIKYLGRGFVMALPEDDNEMDCIWFYLFEIIGNIYQHPELINKP